MGVVARRLVSCSSTGRASTATAALVVAPGVAQAGCLMFQLTGANGKPATLAALHGRVAVLAPFAMLCGTSYAASTAAFDQLVAELFSGGMSNEVALVELSVDPGRAGRHASLRLSTSRSSSNVVAMPAAEVEGPTAHR